MTPCGRPEIYSLRIALPNAGRAKVQLINSARGAIVDETALLDALESNKIAGAGLDVFSSEPLSQTKHPLQKLFKMDNVLLFPHLTFYTKEAMKRLELEVLERCSEVVENYPVIIKSKDPRLLGQGLHVRYIIDEYESLNKPATK
ncbi:NAD(P)-dependent oxidoreductase [Fulvitalea axinellae]